MPLFVARKDEDICTGHDACPSRKAIEGSPDVFLDGKAVVRVGDRWESHGCPAHEPHTGVVTQGSDEVSINGLPVARIGDPLDCGSKVQTGAEALYAGGKLSSVAEMNKLLNNMDPGARPDSIAAAQAKQAAAQQYVPLAKELGERYGIPPALALAHASRESDFGQSLDKNGWGDHGNGYGMFQVDKNSHTPVGAPFSQEHANQAMGIWQNNLRQVQAAHPDWTSSEQMAGAVAAYNFGPKNVQTRPSGATGWQSLDRGTAHDNYSRDVWAQAQWYADNLDWSP